MCKVLEDCFGPAEISRSVHRQLMEAEKEEHIHRSSIQAASSLSEYQIALALSRTDYASR